jgi:hypothetical protein
MFEDDLDLISQAFNNIGNTFGGNTRVALLAVAKEIRRLKRCKEEQESKERMKEIKKRTAAAKFDDDDIPF